MRKPKYITPDNYQQFLPSEFVESFISDIEVAERMGKKMDMQSFTIENATSNCLPCLGGMACMNMGIQPFFFVEDKEYTIATHTAFVGDAIRRGGKLNATKHLMALFPNCNIENLNVTDTTTFCGTLGSGRLPALKAQVMKYVHALQAQGL